MDKNLALILDLSSWHSKVIKTIDRRVSLHGISYSEFLVMYQLSLGTNKSMRRIDLAESVNMSASGVTRLLNPMEKLKIVEKEKNPRDARVSFVKLSDVGFELFTDAMKTLSHTADDLLESLDADETEVLFNIMKKMK